MAVAVGAVGTAATAVMAATAATAAIAAMAAMEATTATAATAATDRTAAMAATAAMTAAPNVPDVASPQHAAEPPSNDGRACAWRSSKHRPVGHRLVEVILDEYLPLQMPYTATVTAASWQPMPPDKREIHASRPSRQQTQSAASAFQQPRPNRAPPRSARRLASSSSSSSSQRRPEAFRRSVSPSVVNLAFRRCTLGFAYVSEFSRQWPSELLGKTNRENWKKFVAIGTKSASVLKSTFRRYGSSVVVVERECF